jgi:hypothetical protein
MDLYRLLIPLGIFSYSFMLLAVLTGTRVIKVKVKHHKLFAMISIAGASIHLVIVLYLYYF